MRVSTAQIFDSGARGILNNQADLFRLQNQMSTGRRILAPEDDPIGSAQALVLSQSYELSGSYLNNQGAAQTKLNVVDTNLGQIGDLLQDVRERIVQAGSTTLQNSDRGFIADELEARFANLLGLANTQDGEGNYLFSGYQGSAVPFSASATGSAVYLGDEGKRFVQVGASRQVATSVSGSQVFESIRTGNGTFATASAGNSAGGNNQGTGIVDQGSVGDLAKWQAALANGALWQTPTAAGNLEVRFSTTAAGVSQYQLFDVSNPAAPTAIGALTNFVSGQSIPLQNTNTLPVTDFGASVVIQGQPAAGDRFSVAPSANQSAFTTLRNVINILRSGVGSSTYSTTEFSNDIAGQLANIDRVLENVNSVRSGVSATLKDLDSLTNLHKDSQLDFKSRLSDLQDLDYAQAITDMSQQKMQLEAAQLTFKQTSQLSLFSIL